MVKFEEMEKLEKCMDEKREREILRYSQYLVDVRNEDMNTRYRILECEGRYYYHEMKDGYVIHCFEIAESWKPFEGVTIWAYTPDNFHVVEIDSRYIWNHEVKDIPGRDPEQGDFFDYKDNSVIYHNRETLIVNGKPIKVIPDSEYVYSFKRKKSIRAMGGAAGLFNFLDHIAFSNSNPLYSHSLFSDRLEQFIEIYG